MILMNLSKFHYTVDVDLKGFLIILIIKAIKTDMEYGD